MLRIRRMLKSQGGFTLVELIIVVVILATLAGIALLNSGGAEGDAKLAKSKVDMDALATALKVYKMKSTAAAYPTTTAGLAALTSTNGNYSPMLDTVPTSPFGSYSYDNTSGTVTLTNGGTGANLVSMTLK